MKQLKEVWELEGDQDYAKQLSDILSLELLMKELIERVYGKQK